MKMLNVEGKHDNRDLREPALTRGGTVWSRGPIQVAIKRHDLLVPQVIFEDVPLIQRRFLLQRVDLFQDEGSQFALKAGCSHKYSVGQRGFGGDYGVDASNRLLQHDGC